MDSAPTVNYDLLQQYIVKFNLLDKGYDCQVTIWPS